MPKYAKYVEAPHKRALAAAESLFATPKLLNPASAIAAFSPATQQAQANVVNAAQLFGMAPQDSSALLESAIPSQYLRPDGMGYSSAPLAVQALGNISQNQPNSWRKTQGLFDSDAVDSWNQNSVWKTGADPNAQPAYSPYSFFQVLQNLNSLR